jgi:8-amino-7-oxononanoate synthase
MIESMHPHAPTFEVMAAAAGCPPLVARLIELASTEPERIGFEWLDRGEPTGPRSCRSYGTLDRRARAVAEVLRRVVAPGARVLLLFAPGLDLVDAFFGCLYAGVVAVPAYPPEPARLDRTLPRLVAIAEDAKVSAVLTQSFVARMRSALPGLPPVLAQSPWIAVDELSEATDVVPVPTPADPIAFLQYTSGSTGTPRGVMVSHGNLEANMGMIAKAMAIRPGDVGVSWLPMFHDMGLIGIVLTAVRHGVLAVVMSPLHFLAQPMAWLRTISATRATVSGGPNFAYALCARRATPSEIRELDLSCWRLAFNGAEPVDPAVMRQFAETFAPAGFRREALFPTYGLAEATLLVSGGPAGAGMRAERFSPGLLERGLVDPHPEGRSIPSCGEVVDGMVQVVDPSTGVALGTDRVGEIWVRGEHVAAGYFGDPEASRASFGARLCDTDGWLRTGDLGFLREGQLWVTGRCKELVIIHGRNIHPHDVEQLAVEAHPEVRPGSVVAFGVPTPTGEGLAVAVETTAEGEALHAIVAAIREAVSRSLGVAIVDVWPVPKKSLPKTSSGKLMRHASRAAFLARSPAPAAPGADALMLVLDELQRQTGLARSALSPTATLAELGVDSVVAATLATELEARLGRVVTVDGLAGRTLAEIARWLDEAPAAASPRPHDDWRDRDVSHFRRATGDDLFEIHEHFARWSEKARPGGYELYDLRMTTAPATTVALQADAERHADLVNLASYNYLGLSTHPEVLEAAAAALRHYGLSASGSPMLSGLLEVHHALERDLAELKAVESMLLFPTGYATNVGVISALVGAGDVVIADALVHASIVDGVAMSQARMVYFRHNDLDALERALDRNRGRVLVAVEGVYSMDGDLAPLPGIVERCRRYGARLLVDEAHSAFVFGEHGRGAAEHFGVEPEVDVHVGTLSKSLGGMGGYVGGSRQLVDYVRTYARARTFSCGLTPPVAGGLRAALAVLRREPERRQRLWSNVAIMREALTRHGVGIGASESQILPVHVHDDRIFAVARELLRAGVYLAPVRFPAVKQHQARFRISVSAAHEPGQLERGAEVIAEVLSRHGALA